MSFAAYYRWSWFLFAAAGFLAVTGTGALGPIPVISFCAALAVAGLIEAALLPSILPRRLVPAVALAALPAAYLDYRFLTQSVVPAAIHLTLVLTGLKLMTREKDSDSDQICLLGISLILEAALLTDGMAFLLCVSLFTVAAVSALTVLEMKRSSSRARNRGRLQPFVVARSLRGTEFELFGGFSARQMFAAVLGLAVFIAGMAIPLFFLLPRTTFGARYTPPSAPQSISGFSERVTLGEIGRILESSDLVMRVRAEGPYGTDIKWRGIALDYFDGKTWVCSRSDRGPMPMQGGYFKLQETARGGSFLMQTIFLEPIATKVVFGAHQMLAISTNLGPLSHDQHDNVLAATVRPGAIRYLVVSDTTPPDPAKITAYSGPAPGAIAARHLQLPKLDPRIAELSRRIAARDPNPYDRARALEAYLRAQYRYSLEQRPRPDSSDPLAEFLFETGSGHCEYFATALAVMLRQTGIPARVVNGFRAGDYNPISETWTVRQYHAHSWVEAWFPSSGWIEFDATPPDPRSRNAGLWTDISRLRDAADLWWSDYVIQYEIRKQSQLLHAGIASLQSRLRSARERIVGLGHAVGAAAFNIAFAKWLAGCLAAILAAALLVTCVPGIRSLRTRLKIGRDPGAAVIGFYAEALDLLRRRGFTRVRSETPLEFAGRMSQQPFGETLAVLTSIYNRIRFAQSAFPDDTARSRQLLQTLKARLP